MSRPDTGSRTEDDAGRYAATHAHAADKPSIHDLSEDDTWLTREHARWVTPCDVCGQPSTPGWCVTCADDKAAEMRQRNEEWFQ